MKKIAILLTAVLLVGCANTPAGPSYYPLERSMAPLNNVWNCYVSFSNKCGPAIAAQYNGVQ